MGNMVHHQAGANYRYAFHNDDKSSECVVIGAVDNVCRPRIDRRVDRDDLTRSAVEVGSYGFR